MTLSYSSQWRLGNWASDVHLAEHSVWRASQRGRSTTMLSWESSSTSSKNSKRILNHKKSKTHLGLSKLLPKVQITTFNNRKINFRQVMKREQSTSLAKSKNCSTWYLSLLNRGSKCERDTSDSQISMTELSSQVRQWSTSKSRFLERSITLYIQLYQKASLIGSITQSMIA